MSIERLVQAGSIHPFRATPDEVSKALEVARRDLALAENIRDESLDSEAHKATFEFMQLAVEQPFKRTIPYFDRVRKKRHRIIYNEVGLVTEKEAEELLKKARGFISYIERKLGKL